MTESKRRKKQGVIETDRQTNRQTDRQTHRYIDRQIDRQTDTQTDTQTDRQTDRQKDRDTYPPIERAALRSIMFFSSRILMMKRETEREKRDRE